MIKVASFVKRPLTEIEMYTIIRAIGSNDLEIVPFKCKRRYVNKSMAANFLYSTPTNYDVVLLKTRPYSIPLWLSNELKQTVLNIRMCMTKNNYLSNDEFVGLEVYKQGKLLETISFDKYSKPMRRTFTRLRQLRRSFKLSQEEVSQYLHISQSNYANIEQGRTLITVDHLITLALMYNVTTDYLLELSNNPEPK